MGNARRNKGADTEPGQRLLLTARAGEEEALDAIALVLLTMEIAISDQHPLTTSARSLIAKLIDVGSRHRERPSRSELSAVLNNLTFFAYENWHEVRLLATSYQRWSEKSDRTRVDAREEEYWRELAFLRVLMRPTSRRSSACAQHLLQPQARRFRSAVDPKGEEAAADAYTRIRQRKSRGRAYEPAGNPAAAISYFRKLVKGALLDIRSSAPEGVSASTYRRWRAEFRRAERGEVALPEDLHSLYRQLFNADDGTTRADLGALVRALKKQRAGQRPNTRDAMTLGDLAKLLGENKTKVRDAARALRRKHPEFGRRVKGTWVFNRQEIGGLYEKLGRRLPHR